MPDSDQYAKIAAKQSYCRSCIMVAELGEIEKFEALGILKRHKNKDGVLIVDIPVERIDDFVILYLEVMTLGSWNEYVGPKSGFYFKLASGETRHIELEPGNESAINESLREFIPAWPLGQDLWGWLASVDIYSDFLKS